MCRESRRRSRDSCSESYITKYTSVLRIALFGQVSGATDKKEKSALPVKAGSSADVPGERTPIPETRKRYPKSQNAPRFPKLKNDTRYPKPQKETRYPKPEKRPDTRNPTTETRDGQGEGRAPRESRQLRRRARREKPSTPDHQKTHPTPEITKPQRQGLRWGWCCALSRIRSGTEPSTWCPMPNTLNTDARLHGDGFDETPNPNPCA